MSPSGCMVNLNAGPLPAATAEICGQPAAYRAWLDGCNICWLMDFPECTGHPVCIRHGADLRTTVLYDKNDPARLARISTLESGAT